MKKACLLLLCLWGYLEAHACSVVYYVDKISEKIYVANNEDYWYDVNAYIQIMPANRRKMARLWYGWDNFAQGGINEAGLFFDGAVTPVQDLPSDYVKPNRNLGDDILASCRSVDEAIDFLNSRNIGLENAHMMFGDNSGKAVVVEWINGSVEITTIKDNHLTMTNFLLTDTSKGNFPCYRYSSIEGRIDALLKKDEQATLLQVGNTIAGAAQPPQYNEKNRTGGTLYSTFINITDMEFVLVYKLDNANNVKIDLLKEFSGSKKRKIELVNLTD